MSELYHHGVLGMKWGIRRYQNYDGSYTQKGMERYRKAKADYDEAKEKVKTAKADYKTGNATKTQYKESKNELKIKKRQLDKSYDRLKNDKKADKGKALYRKGKTISGNMKANEIAQVGIIAGGHIVSRMLSNYGNIDINKSVQIGRLISLGGTAINGILAVKTHSDNKKLRAYYAH